MNESVAVRAGSRTYEVVIGRDLLREAGAVIREVHSVARCVVVSDENVAPLYGEAVLESLCTAGFDAALISVPAGEKSKSLAQVASVCDQMIAAKLDRSSFVIALGGGVVGDLAGFVAAIYFRGIPFVQIPTTILAQVDSSVGGKTGVNAPGGKNLLGSFHQPSLVLADTGTLRTLPPREWNEGFAEVIKHAIIRDREMFGSLKDLNRENLAPLIRRNVEIKAAIVAADEREISGERALLNFGHTVGHAIENAAGYGTLLHGEAISLGIVAACEISVGKAGLPETERAEIVALLEAFSLPTHLPPEIPRHRILDALKLDKKFERGEIRFVVTPRIGEAHLTSDVSFADIAAAIDSISPP